MADAKTWREAGLTPGRRPKGGQQTPLQGRLWAAGWGAGSHPRTPAPAAGLGSGILGGVGVGLRPIIPNVPKGGLRREGRHQLRETAGQRGSWSPEPCALLVPWGLLSELPPLAWAQPWGSRAPPQVTFSPTPQGAAPAPLLRNITKLR